MLKVNFHPECDIPRFIDGANEYAKIWETDGDKIAAAIESLTGLDFRADVYNAIVLANKPSGSYPLILPSNFSTQKKAATLVHELLHKVIIRTELMKQSELENHKILNLVLYDIWDKIYGSDFARQAVADEHVWGSLYQEAWKWALRLSKEERSDKFSAYLSSVRLN